jgi:hypothetical protein
MSENVGASTSRNPKGLHGLYRDNFTFTFIWEDEIVNWTVASVLHECGFYLLVLFLNTEHGENSS